MDSRILIGIIAVVVAVIFIAVIYKNKDTYVGTVPNLNTSAGWAWLGTADGYAWLNTSDGQNWLNNSPAVPDWQGTPSGQAWMNTDAGQAWLLSMG